MLALIAQCLAKALHVLRPVDINQLNSWREWTQSEPLIEFSFDAFDLHELDGAIIIHVGHLPVTVHAEVRAGQDLANAKEV